MGTEQRGIDLPHVTEKFETNIPGIYIAGELGGMGLIKNAVKQGEEAVQYIYESLQKKNGAQYDLVIVGAGPAGISASLAAKKHKLRFLTLEQDSLGGTVFSFPRQKIVMTSSMQLPLHGTVRLSETNKEDLLKLWKDILAKNQLSITEYTKVESITPLQDFFKINLSTGEEITASRVLLATGRRGSPKKLNISGEDLPKVSYRLLDPEQIEQKEILVVGGGDSAIEAAILLADKNRITLSYRGESFSRIKQTNSLKIEDLIRKNQVRVLFNSSVLEISDQSVLLELKAPESKISITNDLVYIFIGGELPTQFLEKIGIKIKTLKGEAILKHKK
jgi:putative YpdA family bacillithiol system oxidoreductase